MQSTSEFLDIAKFADFRWKNANVSKTQGMCHVILIVFGTSLGKVFIIVGYMRQIVGMGGAFLDPWIREQSRKGPFWIGLKFLSYFVI